MKKIVAVILAMLLSVNVVLISKTVTADEPVFHDDFEAGSAAWTYVDGSLSFAGTQQSVVYEGTSSYKMTGTIDSNGAYAGNYQRGLYIPVIPGTEFTFAYMFPSKKVSYVGYILTFSNGKIGYYISLFSGNFVNISSVYLLQYAGESVNAWHAHTVDVYGNYKQAFGNVPQGLHITAVTMMMGDPYYTHKTQTAYFDDIRILIQGNCPPASDFTEDFETGSDGWSYFDGSIGSAGTQQSVVYEGTSAYKMTGTIDSNGAYAGNYRQGLHIPVTSDTQFSFAYEFPNKKVAYVGYYLVFNTGKLGYYISKFNGNFINISTVYLLQYAGESVNTWHAHCANVYENYLKAFGSIPGGLYITGISMMMGDPYYSHNTQTAYFDGISIKKSEFSEDFETGSDGWAYIDGSLIYAGTQQSIVYEGASSYKMTGTIDSNGAYAGYYQHALNIPVTLGLKFNFAYEFPSRKVSYVGYILMFNTGKIGYYISLFSGNFVNISTVYLLQYKYETANIWHAHTADIYANYQQAFGGVPKGLCITGISMMMGDPYYSHNTQTAYFDGISIKKSGFSEDFETGYDGWEEIAGNFQYAGTQTQVVQQGSYAFKMAATRVGESGYAGQYEHSVNIMVTPSTLFTFSYRFPTKAISYIGYLLQFSNGKQGYYISLFSGWFVNNTYYYLCQYHNELVNTWYTHASNVYTSYQSVYGSVPSNLKITKISMIMGDPYFTNQPQTAYFDSITISE